LGKHITWKSNDFQLFFLILFVKLKCTHGTQCWGFKCKTVITYDILQNCYRKRSLKENLVVLKKNTNFISLINYLKEKGSKRDKLRLDAAMGDETAKSKLCNYYKELQLPTGAFPLKLKKDNIPSHIHSYRGYQLLKELGDMKDSHDSLKHLIQFFKSSQRANGSWNEDVRILEHPDLPFWMDPREKRVEILTTAYSTLIMVNEQPTSVVTQRAIEYLKKQQKGDYTFPGFPHTTWLAGASFIGYYGPDSVIGQKMVTIIDDLLAQDQPGSVNQWITSSLLLLGYESYSFPLLSRALNILESSQQPDGLWDSEDEGSIIEVSVNCLITLYSGRRIK